MGDNLFKPVTVLLIGDGIVDGIGDVISDVGDSVSSATAHNHTDRM